MNLAYQFATGGADGAVKLPGSLHVNRKLSQWLRFDRAGFVEAYTGKVELGQGISTALAQIVADELDVDLSQVRLRPASTGSSPDEAITSGSLSIQESGLALRHACAEARAIYLHAAAHELDLPVAMLQVRGGVIRSGNREVTYWELIDDAWLEREATGAVPTKRADAMQVIGRSVARFDLP
ncbi:MAG TPA: molybdopterin cofactor-binding domain-containing protein, partial [Casimicrobiaceae bacterium]|nr:molybdopterin cofactor-binding domain-containing protein [Casimicrobiaceae bacterium]